MPETYDLTVKNMFSDMADDIISYLTGFKIKKLDELNIEFTRVERRNSDMIFKCETDETETKEIAIHIEFQSENDTTMPYRMLRYAAEIMEKHKLLPYQVVIYIGNSKAQMDNGLSYTVGNNKLDYTYKILDAGEIRFLDIAKTNYFDLYPLLPVIDREKRIEEGEKYLRICVDLIKEAPVNINKKKDILFKAELLSGIVYSQEVIKKIFEEVEKMLRLEESSTYKMIIEKGIKEGMEKGIKEGIKEGMEKGKAEIVLKLLNKKFKGLPKKYEEKVLGSDIKTLDRITDDIFDMEKPEDLDKYFA
ncbi:Predicted transposase YdaD [Caldanaerobius fijiensis DSM 17918]|uniref:Predicted transposase YdaD n=1 Tax=Caldanaerobius fijiensis DSM 17918 TaxID=1121256 RepID=A0A1M5EPF7_9THEO|nr:DUF4351 domain-containing protein [Caldanaerobius fijiensis]SHF81056.1 Predicted transposase YdaD [Caldanaerobius fijiensis DSM 17918]